MWFFVVLGIGKGTHQYYDKNTWYQGVGHDACVTYLCVCKS